MGAGRYQPDLPLMFSWGLRRLPCPETPGRAFAVPPGHAVSLEHPAFFLTSGKSLHDLSTSASLPFKFLARTVAPPASSPSSSLPPSIRVGRTLGRAFRFFYFLFLISKHYLNFCTSFCIYIHKYMCLYQYTTCYICV